MSGGQTLIRADRLERMIFLIRGRRVIQDFDLARLFGVSTKALQQAVQRNRARFPADFVFQLTSEESIVLHCQSDIPHTLARHAASRKGGDGGGSHPLVFTGHGAIMAAAVLDSPGAVEVSVQVARALIDLRELLAGDRQLTRKLAEWERRFACRDAALRNPCEVIRQLLAPLDPLPGKIPRPNSR